MELQKGNNLSTFKLPSSSGLGVAAFRRRKRRKLSDNNSNTTQGTVNIVEKLKLVKNINLTIGINCAIGTTNIFCRTVIARLLLAPQTPL